MKNSIIIAKVLSTSYKSTSFVGNPSYWVRFETKEGEILKGYTATNASCGYGCGNFIHRNCELSYHTTKKGNIIIDFMRSPK